MNKYFMHSRNWSQDSRNQSGQVAILTVVMFMLLFSIVVVSFTRVMVAASHETVSDELRAQATAAAESGIEDAKRILTYCYANPTATACNGVIGNQNQTCTDVINSTLLTQLGLRDSTDVVNVDNTKQVKVGSGQEYYLCLKINTLTPDYTGTASAASGKSEIIPLKLRNASGQIVPVANITVEWHSKADPPDGDGVAVLKAGSDFPAISQWTNANNPATMRVEFISVPKTTTFSLDTLTNNARAVTIRPSTSRSGGQILSSLYANGSGSAYNIDYWASNTNPNQANTPFLQRDCSTTNAYACSVPFTETDKRFDPNANDYYLRLQAIYRDAHYRITAYDADGNKLYFDGVQPSVDVTGRASDSFQRINARITPVNNAGDTGNSWWPEYAVDSGGKVCKKLSVAAANGQDGCSGDYN
jgi:Tfp pilus assembly protein PilX